MKNRYRGINLLVTTDNDVLIDEDMDGATVQARITAALASQDVVLLPAGSFSLTGTIAVGSNKTIIGQQSSFTVPSGCNSPAFEIDGESNVHVQGVVVRGGGSPGANCRGFYVRGTCDNIAFADCQAFALGSGFSVRGGQGTVAGTVTLCYFDQCISNDHLQTYGFDVSECEFVEFDRCTANNNYLDGYKLRLLTKAVVLKQCVGNENGQHPSSAGDGIDAYGGGDTFICEGCTFDDNLGNGMTLKTDVDTRDSPSTFGYVRNFQVSNIIARNNLNWGMGIYVNTGSVNQYFDNNPPTAATIPMPKWTRVTGGYFEGNGQQGVYLNSIGVSCSGMIMRRNGEEGCMVGLRSLWTTLTDCIFVANNENASPGTVPELYLRGKHIRVKNPQFYGVDPDIIRTEADLVGTPNASSNVTVDLSQGEDIEVHNPTEDATSVGTVLTGMTSGHCAFHQRGTGSPVGSAYGSPGSTWLQTDATEGRDVLWVKIHGAPNDPATGWARTGPGSVEDANVNYSDGVAGSLTATVGGYTCLSTNAGETGFVMTDTANTFTGGTTYDQGNNNLYLWALGSRILRVNAAAYFPEDDNTISCGTNGLRPLRTYSRSYAGYFEASPAGLDRSFYATILDTESTALPAALGRTGVFYFVECTSGAGSATIGRAGGDTINGAAANFTLLAGDLAMCVSDGGTDWRVKVIG